MRCTFSIFVAEIAVGFVNTTVTIFESDGVTQLTVAILSSHGAFPIETSLVLLVSTLDGTATGLSWRSRLEFDFLEYMYPNIYFTLRLVIASLASIFFHMHVYAHKHAHTHTRPVARIF